MTRIDFGIAEDVPKAAPREPIKSVDFLSSTEIGLKIADAIYCLARVIAEVGEEIAQAIHDVEEQVR